MDFFSTLSTIEEVLLDILDNREERTAGRVGGDATVGASHSANEGTCTSGQMSNSCCHI